MLPRSRGMDDLSRFCCLNSECPAYGQRGAGNLSVTSRYGPDKARRMLRCGTCKTRFSERKGTPLFGARLSPEAVDTLMEHLHEGCGIRQTGRLCRVNRNTVGRYSRLGGEHSRDLHDELVALSPPNARGSVRREVVVRGQEGEELRPHGPGR